MESAVLTQLGISKKAAEIYLAALALGTASVMDLAKHAELKRPTAYIHIEELFRQGLLHKIPIGKREYYRAANPGLLEDRAEKNLQAIKRAMPEFEALLGARGGRPSVVVLEGKKGIEQIYDQLAKANSLRFWSNLADVSQHFQEYFDYIARVVHEKEMVVREIIADTDEARRSSKSFAKIAGRTYVARVTTQKGIGNDSVIYDDTVALFRIHEYNFYVVRIEDKAIADSMKALFDMGWEAANPL